MADLFSSSASQTPDSYDASAIEVLEGLEPVRRRPGMYIGGTDDRALHHLAAEVIDNSMDEAVAGFATRIEVELAARQPPDRQRQRPRHPGRPAPQISRQVGARGHHDHAPLGREVRGQGLPHLRRPPRSRGQRRQRPLERDDRRGRARQEALPPDLLPRRRNLEAGEVGAAPNRRGTTTTFIPDPEIFGADAEFSPERLYKLARSKAYLFAGVEIRWRCDPSLASRRRPRNRGVPVRERPRRPSRRADRRPPRRHQPAVHRPPGFPEDQGSAEWAVAWPLYCDGSESYYCNTIPTPDGGTHEAGLRAALTKGIRAFGDLVGNKKAKDITADDVFNGVELMLSVFIRNPHFQSQTKDRLTCLEAARFVEAAVRDHFDHYLADNMDRGRALLGSIVERAEERLRRRAEREVQRKTATSARKLRLPGKLTDCANDDPEGTEMFIVEGDSAGGSAKQARDRKTQAILPIRGKILNVASATADKIRANSEIADLNLALGCGTRDKFNEDALRYERIVIMTDADVDGAHIATLLMTFFFQEMPELVRRGHLFLAQPPLYRLTTGAKTLYARDDAHRAELEATEFKGKKVEVSRFKGLGEMNPTSSRKRRWTRSPVHAEADCPVSLSSAAGQGPRRSLMGRDPRRRFEFIRAGRQRLMRVRDSTPKAGR